MEDKLLLTVEEAAERLRLGRAYTYRLILSGDLASLKVGRYRRVTPADILEYVERRKAASAERIGGPRE